MLSFHKSHKSQTAPRLRNAAALLVLFALFSLPALAQDVKVTILNSDIGNVAPNTDPNLVNPWGMSYSPTGPFWISDNNSGLTTLYDGNGVTQGLVVTIPPATGTGLGSPTGQVFNSTTDFPVLGNPAAFIFATEDGSISGWNGGASATIEVNNNPGAVYKGIALAQAGGNNYLYATNFRAGSVDVFNGSWAPHSFGTGAFKDSSVPTGYAPFNIANIGGGKLAVTFAKQDAAKHDDVKGPGNGYVDIFDTSGNLLMRLPHNIYLNSPWAVVVAPSGFGGFSGDILVGQFGSGAILAYTKSGQFVGLVFDAQALPSRIDGLWGLMFGNGGKAGPTTTLFFTAGVFEENHGLLGSIVPLPGIAPH